MMQAPNLTGVSLQSGVRHGIFLPDGNTLIPTYIFNALIDQLRDEYLIARDAARDRGYGRECRLANAKVATVCRHALRTLETHDFCRSQTRIA